MIEFKGSAVVHVESRKDLPEYMPLALQKILLYVVLPFELLGKPHVSKTKGETSFEMIAPVQPGEAKRVEMTALETGGIGGGPAAQAAAEAQHQYWKLPVAPGLPSPEHTGGELATAPSVQAESVYDVVE